MTILSFRCTVIRGKFILKDTIEGNIYVRGILDESIVISTDSVKNSSSPVWDQIFSISGDVSEDLTLILYNTNNDIDIELGRCSIELNKIYRKLNKFNFWRRKRVKIPFINVSSENQSIFKLIVGFSRIPGSLLVTSNSDNRATENIPIFRQITRTSTNAVNLIEGIYAHDILTQEFEVIVEKDDELAYGWEIRTIDEDRQMYFDTNTHIGQFNRPQSLPSGWEIRKIVNDDRHYYYNCQKNTIFWQRPNNQNHSILNGTDNQDVIESYETSRQRFMKLIMKRKDLKTKTNYLNDRNILTVVNLILGPLPENWTSKLDKKQNKIFFFDIKTKGITWKDPRMDWLDSDIFKLPQNIEIGINNLGIPYFVNRSKKKTFFEDPRTGLPIIPTSLILIWLKASFRDKILIFNATCAKLVRIGSNKVIVKRDNLFLSSFPQIMKLSPKSLHRVPFVAFYYEEGVDYGGLLKEWMQLTSRDILAPQHKLFVNNGLISDYLFDINPNAINVENYEEKYVFVGRLIGMALFYSQSLELSLPKSFYKKILNIPYKIDDLQQVDHDMYTSLKWISVNSIKESAMELYFAIEMESEGILKLIELKPDGAKIEVTDENKREFIDLMIDWKLNYSKQDQYKYLLSGINHIIPITWLRPFSVTELEMLLNGIIKYDVKDWSKHTQYVDYNTTHRTIQFFWEFVNKSSDETRGKLLCFVTGSSRLPPTGFKDLMSRNQPKQFSIKQSGHVKRLPRSHTCFNILALPPYTTYADLEQKLTIAINEANEFSESA